MLINERIVAETILCEKNFECLKSNMPVHCKVENCVSEKVHFVESLDNSLCRYIMIFGSSKICTCPTRKEIFNKYKL
jgi:hypothetical protein